MTSIYGPLNKIGKIIAIPLSFLVSNRFFYRFFTIGKIYLSILLGQGAGTGWKLDAETNAAINIIKKYGEKKDHFVIFDVGANKGEWSRLLSRKIKNATFYLFEPQKGCHAYILNKNIPNFVLVSNAVSAVGGESIDLFSTSDTAGLASVYKRRDSYFQIGEYQKQSVTTITLDSVIETNHIKSVDYMKMDIEGHELEALKGAYKNLKNGTIRAIAFEFGSGNINSKTYFHDFWDLLMPLGYCFYRILPWGGVLPILEYSEDLEYFRGATNYLAVLNF